MLKLLLCRNRDKVQLPVTFSLFYLVVSETESVISMQKRKYAGDGGDDHQKKLKRNSNTGDDSEEDVPDALEDPTNVSIKFM